VPSTNAESIAPAVMFTSHPSTITTVNPHSLSATDRVPIQPTKPVQDTINGDKIGDVMEDSLEDKGVKHIKAPEWLHKYKHCFAKLQSLEA